MLFIFSGETALRNERCQSAVADTVHALQSEKGGSFAGIVLPCHVWKCSHNQHWLMLSHGLVGLCCSNCIYRCQKSPDMSICTAPESVWAHKALSKTQHNQNTAAHCTGTDRNDHQRHKQVQTSNPVSLQDIYNPWWLENPLGTHHIIAVGPFYSHRDKCCCSFTHSILPLGHCQQLLQTEGEVSWITAVWSSHDSPYLKWKKLAARLGNPFISTPILTAFICARNPHSSWTWSSFLHSWLLQHNFLSERASSVPFYYTEGFSGKGIAGRVPTSGIYPGDW